MTTDVLRPCGMPAPAGAEVLAPGVWLWIYPKRTWRNILGKWPDATGTAAELSRLGVRGVIPHGVTDPLAWLTEARVKAFTAFGLRVAVGVGSRGPGRWEQWARSIVAALDTDLPVMADWEIAWSGDEGKPAARKVVDYVLHHHPKAIGRVTDCPWWAPLHYLDSQGRKRPTHPRAPTAEFGRLCALERYVQAYGATMGDGASMRMLKWARHPSQYASLGPWSIRGAHQAYKRGLQDFVETIVGTRSVCLWQLTELEPACELALRVDQALIKREVYRHEDMPPDGKPARDLIRAWQRAAGITVDGLVGPQTLRSLGLGS